MCGCVRVNVLCPCVWARACVCLLVCVLVGHACVCMCLRAHAFAAVDGVVHAKSKRTGERCAAPAAPAVTFDPPSAFALGSAGGTSCPSGRAAVLNPADCQTAAASAARPHGGAVRVGGLPAGCVWLTVGAGSFFFNNAVGGGNGYAQPVCAGAPDSKHRQCPSSANICMRAGLFVCVRTRSCVRACVCPPTRLPSHILRRCACAVGSHAR
jgi:hypothetical protein